MIDVRLRRFASALFALSTSTGCGPRLPPGFAAPAADSSPPTVEASTPPSDAPPPDAPTLVEVDDEAPASTEDPIPTVDPSLDATERSASPGGRAVLEAARAMIAARVVVKGSCWDFVSAVYRRAADAHSHQKTLYSAAKKGPYASPTTFEPGDWLYLIHHGGTEHSVIFVRWVGAGMKKAVVADYLGGRRERPGEFRTVEVERVYHVMRLVED